MYAQQICTFFVLFYKNIQFRPRSYCDGGGCCCWLFGGAPSVPELDPSPAPLAIPPICWRRLLNNSGFWFCSWDTNCWPLLMRDEIIIWNVVWVPFQKQSFDFLRQYSRLKYRFHAAGVLQWRYHFVHRWIGHETLCQIRECRIIECSWQVNVSNVRETG